MCVQTKSCAVVKHYSGTTNPGYFDMARLSEDVPTIQISPAAILGGEGSLNG